MSELDGTAREENQTPEVIAHSEDLPIACPEHSCSIFNVEF